MYVCIYIYIYTHYLLLLSLLIIILTIGAAGADRADRQILQAAGRHGRHRRVRGEALLSYYYRFHVFLHVLFLSLFLCIKQTQVSNMTN